MNIDKGNYFVRVFKIIFFFVLVKQDSIMFFMEIFYFLFFKELMF